MRDAPSRVTARVPSLVALVIGCSRAAPQEPDAAPAGGSSLRVMSFNLRQDEPRDGANAWPHRRDIVAELIESHGCDLIGVQEVLAPMLADLQERLPSHAWVGVGRADGKSGGEFSAVFYRTDRLALLDHGTSWLSETPDVPGSRSWDAALERIVTWASFRDRSTGRTFHHFNTHFDHRGEVARLESARLLLRPVRELAGTGPAVVTGDLNCLDTSPPYRALVEAAGESGPLLRDALRATESPHEGPRSTWNGFEGVVPDHRIDFVFVTDGVRVLRHAILPDTHDGRFPSDHLPVLAEIVLE